MSSPVIKHKQSLLDMYPWPKPTNYPSSWHSSFTFRVRTGKRPRLTTCKRKP